MKLCRYEIHGQPQCGFYEPQRILPIHAAAQAVEPWEVIAKLASAPFESLLPIHSQEWKALESLHHQTATNPDIWQSHSIDRNSVKLLPPIAQPKKLLLLAGNYAAHIEEQGWKAAERNQTFPYVFLKPASTTLVGDRAEVPIPKISPSKIDHEVELAVVIGREARSVNRSVALDYVAGYTIINDLSDRGFQPNPDRKDRPRDKHFDWMHGKWHDGFCPCGPNLTTADEISDPQDLWLKLWVDDELRQEGSTSDQVFSVAEVIEFLSSWMTLEPGDILATGTPSGVGNASGKFLRAGQTIVAEIPAIGRLTTTMA